jgi:hypothetical protein
MTWGSASLLNKPADAVRSPVLVKLFRRIFSIPVEMGSGKDLSFRIAEARRAFVVVSVT